MRLALAFAAALGLAGLAVAVPGSEAQAQDTASFNDKFKVEVKRTGEDLAITISGVEVGDEKTKTQWYVNRDYPMNLKLSAGKATLGKAELAKEDAAFEGTEKTGKAKKATFKTTVKGADKVKVNYKLVVCSETSCSPPIKGEFSEP